MAKVICITGAAGGIGQALIKEFKSKNFEVIGIDLVDSVEGIHYFKCDLTDVEASLKVFEQIKKDFPEISYWFNNAGVARLGTFLEVPQKDFDLVMKVNFDIQVTAIRFWLPYFEQKGKGTIINMSSAAGILPGGGMSSYVASKYALVGFTKSLQIELEAFNSPVKMILVTPGFVETNIMQIGTRDGFPEKLKKLISTPASCAKEIVSGILEGKKEITPTMSGKVMTGLYKLPFCDDLIGLVYKSKVNKKL